MTKTTRLILLAVTALLSGGLAYRQYGAYQTALMEREEAAATRDETQERANRLPLEQQREVQLRIKNEKLQRTLPETEQLSDLLRELRLSAKERGLEVTAFNRKTAPASLPGITAITLNLSVTGPYPKTQAWLNDLNRNERTLNIPTASLTADPDGVKTQLTVIAYARNVKPPAAAENTTPTTSASTGTEPDNTASIRPAGGTP